MKRGVAIEEKSLPGDVPSALASERPCTTRSLSFSTRVHGAPNYGIHPPAFGRG